MLFRSSSKEKEKDYIKLKLIESFGEGVVEVFDHLLEARRSVGLRNTMLTGKRAAAISDRLEDYTVDDCKLVIDRSIESGRRADASGVPDPFKFCTANVIFRKDVFEQGLEMNFLDEPADPQEQAQLEYERTGVVPEGYRDMGNGRLFRVE